MSVDEAARAALRARQGSGARYDAPAAPARELGWARRGTAYFARLLNTMSDAELDRPSMVPGWSRRHVVAHVGYGARRLCRIIEAARASRDAEIETPEDRAAEIALGATLPAHALRNLFKHTEVHLNVEWRDLTDADWDRPAVLPDGTRATLRDTAPFRARDIWMRSVELGLGATYDDMPPDLREDLPGDLDDVPSGTSRS